MTEHAAVIYSVLRAPALRQPEAIQPAFAVVTTSEVRIISALSGDIDSLGEVVAEHFVGTGTLTSTVSQPGLGVTPGALVRRHARPKDRPRSRTSAAR